MDNDAFKKQLDELFRLFNKLMEKHPMDEISGLSKVQLEQMRLFLKNYELMKDHISFEMFGQANEHIYQMIGMFIRQLREELGEPELTKTQPTTENSEQLESIAQIDARLRDPQLSEEEINRLLDERMRLTDEASRS
ncbi:MAG: hypothetical protein H3C41_08635 [Bacteroidales bacterium]|nr:hypothetical protein [Bacteroidales bacterium]